MNYETVSDRVLVYSYAYSIIDKGAVKIQNDIWIKNFEKQ